MTDSRSIDWWAEDAFPGFFQLRRQIQIFATNLIMILNNMALRNYERKWPTILAGAELEHHLWFPVQDKFKDTSNSFNFGHCGNILDSLNFVNKTKILTTHLYISFESSIVCDERETPTNNVCCYEDIKFATSHHLRLLKADKGWCP